MPKYIVYPKRVPGKEHVVRLSHFDNFEDAYEAAHFDELEIAEVLDQTGWFFRFLVWLSRL